MGQLFTPFISGHTQLRAHMELSDEDHAKFDSLTPNSNKDVVEIYDELSMESYSVRRAACNLDCFCAAEIVSPIKF